jgi:hypothetical protein
MLLFVAFLFLGFLAMQWAAHQASSRRPEVWGLSRRRLQRMARQANPEQRRAFLEAADGGPAKTTPPVFYAALAMTLIAIGVLLWL